MHIWNLCAQEISKKSRYDNYFFLKYDGNKFLRNELNLIRRHPSLDHGSDIIWGTNIHGTLDEIKWTIQL